MINKRVDRVLAAMREANLTQMVISDPGAIFYLSGKWIHPGERMLALYLSTQKKGVLIVNELFPIPEDLGIDIAYYNDIDSPVALLAKAVNKEAPLGIDKTWPSRFLIELMELGAAIKVINSSYIVDNVRMIKDQEECELMRKASLLNDQAMEQLQQYIQPGMTEKQVADKLAQIYEKLGADGYSFEPIIAFGPNGANPHHSTGSAVAKTGDSVIFDIGCIKDSYCSDMTRTIFLGEATPKQQEVYSIVRNANLAAIAAVKPGVRFCDIDKAARDYIAQHGYGDRFLHRTGHSIGLECHEFGDVSSINTMKVAPGMIFSIEPGVYLTGDFGVRIEDLVLVTEDGCEVLNHYTKELQVVK